MMTKTSQTRGQVQQNVGTSDWRPVSNKHTLPRCAGATRDYVRPYGIRPTTQQPQPCKGKSLEPQRLRKGTTSTAPSLSKPRLCPPRKGQKTLKLAPQIYESLQKEKVTAHA